MRIPMGGRRQGRVRCAAPTEWHRTRNRLSLRAPRETIYISGHMTVADGATIWTGSPPSDAFVRVAETQSFSEAARRLRSSKSAVSRSVGALEAELGARLFNRTTRSLNLTEAGRAYFERVSRILADLDDADRALGQHQASPRGRLMVSAPMSFGFLHLAPALPEFLARFPEVDVELSLNDRFVDLVDDGFDRRAANRRLAGFEPDGAADRARSAGRCAPAPTISASRGTPQAPGRPESARMPAQQQCLAHAGMAIRRRGRQAAARPGVRPGQRQQRRRAENHGARRLRDRHAADLHRRRGPRARRARRRRSTASFRRTWR